MRSKLLKTDVSKMFTLLRYINDALSDPKKRKARNKALTIIELILVILLLGTILAMAIPIYHRQLEKARVTKAISDIRRCEQDLIEYMMERGTFLPDTLETVRWNNRTDPWGTPYEYLKIEGAENSVKGKWRKDRWLVPLNSDFDLYSKGKDKKSQPPLTALASWDDVVRAGNGSYIGLGKEY
jgi:general secretion pathway protein G